MTKTKTCSEILSLQQTVITSPVEKSTAEFSLQLITTREQVRDLIQEFEPDVQLQDKDQISLNGLSENEHLL